MTYYKAFNTDLACRGYQFEIGTTYFEDEIRMCKKGFHCCKNPIQCLRHYKLPLRLCEVSIGDNFDERSDKTVTSQITIIREIVGEELKNILTGDILHLGKRYWYKEGNLHRDGDLPAIVYENPSSRKNMDRIVSAWYKEGKLHREGDLPAVIYESGGTERYINGIKKDDIQFDILREKFLARLHKNERLAEQVNYVDTDTLRRKTNYMKKFSIDLPDETIE